MDEFEEKIDKIDKDSDGSHPWLEQMLHNLRQAKKDVENEDIGVNSDEHRPKLSNQAYRQQDNNSGTNKTILSMIINWSFKCALSCCNKKKWEADKKKRII